MVVPQRALFIYMLTYNERIYKPYLPRRLKADFGSSRLESHAYILEFSKLSSTSPLLAGCDFRARWPSFWKYCFLRVYTYTLNKWQTYTLNTTCVIYHAAREFHKVYSSVEQCFCVQNFCGGAPQLMDCARDRKWEFPGRRNDAKWPGD